MKNEQKERSTLLITVNGKAYDWPNQYITATDIRQLAGINQDHEILLAVKKPWKDELISDGVRVNLARPEIEHFYTEAKTREFTIVVNGSQHKWNQKKITFKEVIVLAYGHYDDRVTMVYTAAYEDGPKQNPEGSMLKGDTVIVKNKMIFHATATDKS